MRAARPGLMVLLAIGGCGDSSGATQAGEGSTTGAVSSGSGDSEAQTPTTSGEATEGTDGPAPVCVSDGPPTVKWKHTGEELPRDLRAIAVDGAGDTVIVGQGGPMDNDVFVQLYDPSGAPLWSDVYAGTQGLYDRALDVVVDGAGFLHVLVNETVFSLSGQGLSTSDRRLVILRYAPDGTHVWRWEREREPVEPGGSYDVDGHLGVDGETVYLFEEKYGDPPIVIALDGAGNVLSEAVLALPDNVTADRRALGADGVVYLAGNIDDGQTGHLMWLGRFASDGSLAWRQTFGSPKQDRVEALTAGREGEVYVAHTLAPKPGQIEHHLRRIDDDGELAWSVLLPLAAEFDAGIGDAALDCDGSPLLVGSIGKPAEPGSAWDHHMDLWAARYGTDGALGWTFELETGMTYHYGGLGRIAVAPGGDFVAFGSYMGEDGANYVPWLGRLSGD